MRRKVHAIIFQKLIETFNYYLYWSNGLDPDKKDSKNLSKIFYIPESLSSFNIKSNIIMEPSNEWQDYEAILCEPININNVSQTADNLYINIGILSDIQDLHTGQFINILISEETDTPFNDNLNNNASDLFESTMEVYKMKVPVDWDGWKMKSFRYSDFEPVSPNNQDINFNMNPNDIRAIRISCQACPSSAGNPVCPENFGKDVRTDIDHIIFTANLYIIELVMLNVLRKTTISKR